MRAIVWYHPSVGNSFHLRTSLIADNLVLCCSSSRAADAAPTADGMEGAPGACEFVRCLVSLLHVPARVNLSLRDSSHMGGV